MLQIALAAGARECLLNTTPGPIDLHCIHLASDNNNVISECTGLGELKRPKVLAKTSAALQPTLAAARACNQRPDHSLPLQAPCGL